MPTIEIGTVLLYDGVVSQLVPVCCSVWTSICFLVAASKVWDAMQLKVVVALFHTRSLQHMCLTSKERPRIQSTQTDHKLIFKKRTEHIYIYMFHTSAPASVPSHLFKQEPCVRHEVFEKVGSVSRF